MFLKEVLKKIKNVLMYLLKLVNTKTKQII